MGSLLLPPTASDSQAFEGDATFFNPSTLRDVIEQAVQFKTGRRIRNLDVRISNRQVVISGSASSYYSKQLVTQAAMLAAEDLAVKNEIEVR